MTQILFRNSHETTEELEVAKKYFDTVQQRTDCTSKIVVGRYSVLPFYAELEKDLANKGCELINSYHEHRWIANFDYYHELKSYTFETWFDLRDIPSDGSFVVKGRTNSRKARWNTQMFAKDRITAINIATELMQDPMLENQGIIVRRYVPLELLEVGLNEQPFVNEHRLFFFGTEILASGFYWSQSEEKADLDQEGIDFACEIAGKVCDHVGFFVLDIAKTAEGKWMLVEINDGQMSGLSCCDPHDLYCNLAFYLGDLRR